jgi:hypothetical protein
MGLLHVPPRVGSGPPGRLGNLVGQHLLEPRDVGAGELLVDPLVSRASGDEVLYYGRDRARPSEPIVKRRSHEAHLQGSDQPDPNVIAKASPTVGPTSRQRFTPRVKGGVPLEHLATLATDECREPSPAASVRLLHETGTLRTRKKSGAGAIRAAPLTTRLLMPPPLPARPGAVGLLVRGQLARLAEQAAGPAVLGPPALGVRHSRGLTNHRQWESARRGMGSVSCRMRSVGPADAALPPPQAEAAGRATAAGGRRRSEHLPGYLAK